MAAHTWMLAKDLPRNDRYRTYVCSRCGAGPVQKDILADKSSITNAAKSQGVSPDCYLEIASKIHES